MNLSLRQPVRKPTGPVGRVRVRAVHGRRDLDVFIRLPWRRFRVYERPLD